MYLPGRGLACYHFSTQKTSVLHTRDLYKDAGDVQTKVSMRRTAQGLDQNLMNLDTASGRYESARMCGNVLNRAYFVCETSMDS
jgi:hypothetical protein